jgi:thymidine kinase
MELLVKSKNVFKMTGKCAKCGGASCYSHRVVNNTNYFQILIGTKEYIPLCETCYIKENNL